MEEQRVGLSPLAAALLLLKAALLLVGLVFGLYGVSYGVAHPVHARPAPAATSLPVVDVLDSLPVVDGPG